MNVMANTKTESVTAVKELTDKEKSIILFNDEEHTFDFVIETLIELCDHDLIQAEQCTTIVHYKGKCDVKRGSFNELKPICSEMLNRGLTAEIA